MIFLIYASTISSHPSISATAGACIRSAEYGDPVEVDLTRVMTLIRLCVLRVASLWPCLHSAAAASFAGVANPHIAY